MTTNMNMNIIIKTAVVLTNIITTTTLTNIMNITNIATTTMNIIILTADAAVAVAADTNMVTVNKKKHL